MRAGAATAEPNRHHLSMKTPRYPEIRNVPLPTDVELLPHLTALLEGAFRHQLWMTFLDEQLCPLPVMMPTDLPHEADPRDVEGVSEMMRCVALDLPGSTLVLTVERPGPIELTRRDRRWLRLIREAAVAAELPFRGPYLLLGSSVRQVPPDEYLAESWTARFDEDGDDEYDRSF